MKAAGVDKDAIGCEICKPAVGSILSSLCVAFINFGKTTNQGYSSPDIMNRL